LHLAIKCSRISYRIGAEYPTGADRFTSDAKSNDTTGAIFVMMMDKVNFYAVIGRGRLMGVPFDINPDAICLCLIYLLGVAMIATRLTSY